MVRYGYALDHGQGVSANAQEACDWYEKAAGLGDAMGMNNLGACFANGTGRPTNLQMAVEWYERAAALRNGLALKNLGDLYAVGKGIPRDEAKATDYYRRSAEAGTPSGMIKYEFMLDHGSGVATNHALHVSGTKRQQISRTPVE